MAKKRTRTWYINKLFDKAKKYVKERDNYICQYSGKKVSGSNCHCSHVLNRGHYAHAALDPFNMKTLSSYYHLHWWHKDVLHSSLWFRQKFPDRYDYLMILAQEKKKIPTLALEQLHENTKADGSDYAEQYFLTLEDLNERNS